MAADARYTRQLAVTLASLASAQPAGTCDVTVFNRGIDRRDRQKITACVMDRIKVTWVDISSRTVKGLHYETSGTPAIMFRLMLPELLPGVDRTIYLDTDVVVLSPLTELWRVTLGEAILGAVRDAVSPWAAGPNSTHWRDLNLSPDTPYFNSGVLLIPLSKWREQQVGRAALDIVRMKALAHEDQDALNAVAQGQWIELPRRWNVQTMDCVGQTIGWALMREEIESALADPAIIHYTRPGRPWWPGCCHPRAEMWFQHLDRTSWAGWRPVETRTAWREAGSRLKKAGRALAKGL